MSNHYLIIEDDKIQAEELARRLRATGGEVTIISTELEFRNRLATFDRENCRLAIVDMMLRWTNPSRDMVMPPDEISKEGFFIAGLRCCRELWKKRIPSVIFTALDPSRVPVERNEPFRIVNKSQGFEALLDVVKQPV